MAAALTVGNLTYLGMLLPWALAVVALQWALGARSLRPRLRLLATATTLPTLYLIAADSVALSQGIWSIHDDRILGLRIGNVPVEEALFFLLTNLMVVQSIILLNAPEMRTRALALIRRLSRARRRHSVPAGEE